MIMFSKRWVQILLSRIFIFLPLFVSTHIEEQSTHTSQKETAAIEWIVKAPIQFVLSFAFVHSYLMNMECSNTMTMNKLAPKVIWSDALTDIADAIRQSVTFPCRLPSINDDFSLSERNIKKEKKTTSDVKKRKNTKKTFTKENIKKKKRQISTRL
jgi:hypothetical protein